MLPTGRMSTKHRVFILLPGWKAENCENFTENMRLIARQLDNSQKTTRKAVLYV